MPGAEDAGEVRPGFGPRTEAEGAAYAVRKAQAVGLRGRVNKFAGPSSAPIVISIQVRAPRSGAGHLPGSSRERAIETEVTAHFYENSIFILRACIRTRLLNRLAHRGPSPEDSVPRTQTVGRIKKATRRPPFLCPN